MRKFVFYLFLFIVSSWDASGQWDRDIEEHKRYYEKADEHMVKENYRIAIRYYTDALEKAPIDVLPVTTFASFYGRGSAKFLIEDYHEAIKDFEIVIGLIESEGKPGGTKIDYDGDAKNIFVIKTIRANAYLLRGITYRNIGETSLACKDLFKAAGLGKKEEAYQYMEDCPY